MPCLVKIRHDALKSVSKSFKGTKEELICQLNEIEECRIPEWPLSEAERAMLKKLYAAASGKNKYSY